MERIFRGKTLSQDEHFDDGEWVEGYYTCFNGKEHRIYSGYAETDCGDYYPDWFNVRPETVGQYTGLKDKNAKKIFEGDIHERDGHYFVVKHGKFESFENSGSRYGWYFEAIKGDVTEEFYGDEEKYVNIIGNIHDNKDLLEVK